MALDPTQIDPAADPAAAAPAETESAGYIICIKVGADGKISVGVENEGSQQAETHEQQAYEESDLQPVESIKEALTKALEIYRADGDASGLGQEDADFNSGYKPQMGM